MAMAIMTTGSVHSFAHPLRVVVVCGADAVHDYVRRPRFLTVLR